MELRNRSWLSLAAGDVAGALAMAEEALELTQQLDESVLSAWAAMAVARASVHAGDARRAVDLLAPADVLRSIPVPGGCGASTPSRPPMRRSIAAPRQSGSRPRPMRSRVRWACRWPSLGRR
jgi:hypothetical protein